MNRQRKLTVEWVTPSVPTSYIFSLLAIVIWLVVPGGAWAKDKARVGITNTSSDITFFIADKRGFFAEEDIEVEFVTFPSATQMVAPLGTGELDVGAGAPGAGLYNAAARGIAVKIVADKGSMPPGYGYFSLLVRKDLIDSGRVKSFADLKGLKIGDLSKQGSGDVTLNEALKKGGLHFSDVETLYMGGPQLAVALENRAMDAALITEPSASIVISRGAAVMFASGDQIYPNQQLAATLFSEKLIKTRGDVAQRFMNAYVRAARVYNDALKDGRLAGKGTDEIIDLLVERTNIKDRAIYRSITPQGMNPDGCPNKTGLRHDFAFYAEMGWVDKKLDPDSLVDESFCNKASAKLGPYSRPQ
jgi:NitT/TauT family transport system substrate-binding protein